MKVDKVYSILYDDYRELPEFSLPDYNSMKPLKVFKNTHVKYSNEARERYVNEGVSLNDIIPIHIAYLKARYNAHIQEFRWNDANSELQFKADKKSAKYNTTNLENLIVSGNYQPSLYFGEVNVKKNVRNKYGDPYESLSKYYVLICFDPKSNTFTLFEESPTYDTAIMYQDFEFHVLEEIETEIKNEQNEVIDQKLTKPLFLTLRHPVQRSVRHGQKSARPGRARPVRRRTRPVFKHKEFVLANDRIALALLADTWLSNRSVEIAIKPVIRNINLPKPDAPTFIVRNEVNEFFLKAITPHYLKSYRKYVLSLVFLVASFGKNINKNLTIRDFANRAVLKHVMGLITRPVVAEKEKKPFDPAATTQELLKEYYTSPAEFIKKYTGLFYRMIEENGCHYLTASNFTGQSSPLKDIQVSDFRSVLVLVEQQQDTDEETAEED
jgi:hypothetical protein